MRLPGLAMKRKQWEPFAFASPSLVLIGFVILFPLAYSFYLSFQNFDLSVERRGLEKQKAAWGEKLHEMKSLGIEYKPDWAAKAK